MTQLLPIHARPSLSALEACLLHVAAQLDRPLTVAATARCANRNVSGELTLRDAIEVAQSAGLQAGYGKRRLQRL